MYRSPFRFLSATLFFGALFFFVPPLLIAGLMVFFAVRVLGRQKFHRFSRLAWADKIRTMSDEEYAFFREKLSTPCHHGKNRRPESEFV